MEPSSQLGASGSSSRNRPVTLAGAQMSRFQQARSPTGHQDEPGQLVASVALGAEEHGAASQAKLLGESARTFGGHACLEHGFEPKLQVFAPHVPELPWPQLPWQLPPLPPQPPP